MNTASINPDGVRDVILQCLASDRASVGRRLRSELDLCELFGLGRWQIRQVLQSLVADGVLSKRRGSGTFVTRLPQTPDQVYKTRVQLGDLLAEDSSEADPLTMLPRRPRRQSYKLQLWAEWGSSYLSGQMVLAGMIERANEEGHVLSVHSLFSRGTTSRNADDVVTAINESDCDGAILSRDWVALNMPSVEKCVKPIVTMLGGTAPSLHRGPSVMFDALGALEHAVERFAGAGSSRIAVICLEVPHHATDRERSVYDSVCRRLGLTYRCFQGCSSTSPSAAGALARILDNEEPAEAVYVSDDIVLSGVVEELRCRKLVPGRDLAVITLSNNGLVLPGDTNWSRMELDGRVYGRLVIDALGMHLSSGLTQLPNIKVGLNWIEGESHRLA